MAKTYAATAPGRLDIMGGIADYSGSLVLEMPIAETTTARVTLRDDGVIRVSSANARSLGLAETAEVRLEQFVNHRKQIAYERVAGVLQKLPRASWAAYPIGCALVLIKEKRARFRGADIVVDSSVPAGKGVSASAALEVAVMVALGQALRVTFKPLELPLLCQRVENYVVGAPCGIMDQVACFLGRKNQVLPILCQPAGPGKPVTLLPPIPVPPGIRFVGVDSGVRHAVGGSSYTHVRTAAFMGYSLIALAEGVNKNRLLSAQESGDGSKLPFGGSLANIPVSLFEEKYRRLLPETMTGAEFLRAAGGIIDPVTHVNLVITYNVLAAAVHPVYESHRVRLFKQLLVTLGKGRVFGAAREEVLVALGELMYQSHASYSACGLGSRATDGLVEAARAAGPRKGVYGAKITGGGSGGTVCFLCEGGRGAAAVKTIARRAGRSLHLFR